MRDISFSAFIIRNDYFFTLVNLLIVRTSDQEIWYQNKERRQQISVFHCKNGEIKAKLTTNSGQEKKN